MKLYRQLRLRRINNREMVVMNGDKQLTHGIRDVEARRLLNRLSEIEIFR